MHGRDNKGYKVKPLSRVDIRATATDVRDIISAGMNNHSPAIPVVEAFEWLASSGDIEFDIIEDKDMPGLAAQMIPLSVPVINVAESIYNKACNGDPFSRFTLAHEMGHLVLHADQPQPFDRQTKSNGLHKVFEDSEWQANAFAAELLVDLRLVRAHCSSSYDIKTYFGVGDTTARLQWKEFQKCGK